MLRVIESYSAAMSSSHTVQFGPGTLGLVLEDSSAGIFIAALTDAASVEAQRVLRRGDFLCGVNDTALRSAERLRSAIEIIMAAPRPVLLTFRRRVAATAAAGAGAPPAKRQRHGLASAVTPLSPGSRTMSSSHTANAAPAERSRGARKRAAAGDARESAQRDIDEESADEAAEINLETELQSASASASRVDAVSAAPHASADAASSALPSAPPAAPPSEPPSAPPSAPPSSNNSSKFRGVYPSSNVRTGWLQGKWQASTYHNNVRVDLGLFNDEHAAARAYDKAAIRLRGASAVLNFPEEEYALICGTQSFLERSPGN